MWPRSKIQRRQLQICRHAHFGAAQRSAAQRSAAQRSAAQRSAAQRSAAQRSAAQRSAAQRSAAQRSAAQRSAAQRSAAQRSAAAVHEKLNSFIYLCVACCIDAGTWRMGRWQGTARTFRCGRRIVLSDVLFSDETAETAEWC